MRLKQENAVQYMLAGYATVTFLNTQTGNQFTFVIKRKRIGSQYQNFWYVNTGWKVWAGSIDNHKRFHGNVEIAHNQEVKTFDWMWRHIQNLTVPDHVHILHDGNCSACRRKLTDAISIYLGLGPTCCKRLGIPFKIPENVQNS